MTTAKQMLPLLSKHEGVWDGWYRHYDPNGKMIDEHKSRLVCRFPDSGPLPYHQTNHYSWHGGKDDGKREVRDFPRKFTMAACGSITNSSRAGRRRYH